MTHYKIYDPNDKQWCEAEAPGIEEACAIYGVRSNRVFVYEIVSGKAPKLVAKPSVEPERSVYLGGELK